MDEMEEIYFRVHAQMVHWSQRVLSAKNRERLEQFTFVLATQLLVLTCLLHLSFVSPHGHADCLGRYLPEETFGGDQLRLLRIQVAPAASEWAFIPGVTHHDEPACTDASVANEPSTRSNANQYRDPVTAYVFAPQKGLLSLIEHEDQLQTEVQMDTLYLPSSSECFQLKWVGESDIWAKLRDYYLGYDTILMNHLVKHYGAQGYFYHESTKTTVDLTYGVFNPAEASKSLIKYISLKFKILHTILFLFFIMTALVAFVLVETQKRMITFTALFQNRSQLQIPFANLIVAYFAQSLMFVPVLVGMLFFLFELYNDHLLAFAVMSIMWIGESFSVTSVRCRLSQVYFPPLFFCLFTFFHLYLFSFPFGFSYVALLTTTILLLQLILFFWNCFEIPALTRGEISLSQIEVRDVRVMTAKELPDWRSPEQALALDLSLVKSVFRRLARKRRESNQDDGSEKVRTLPSELDQLLFAKSDVLITLKTAGLYLEKRPMLRSLHMSIACVSNEKEVLDLQNFVRHRLRVHSISYAMAKDKLVSIYESTREKEAFEQKVMHFKLQAKASSPWCVRNWKCVAKSPSRFYDIYKIPPKPKTAQQLELERRVLTDISREAVATAMDAAVAKLISPVIGRSGSSSGSGGRPHSQQEGDLRANGVKPLSRSRYDDVLRLRARSRRNQAEREERVRQLRLELFVPDLSSARTAAPGFAQPSPAPGDGSASDSLTGFENVDERMQELLALAEANGDVRIAQQLLSHSIPRSGFRRAVEQAKNLDVPADNLWEVVKIWRSVYRTRIMQALNNATGS